MTLSNQNIFGDSRGLLGVTEFSELPFEPRRFFWIYGTPEHTSRAGHAHKTCHQFLIVQQGIVKISVTDKTGAKTDYVLESGSSFHLEPGNWLDLENFSSGSVLGVFASLPYDRNEYIETLEDFLNFQ